MTAQLPPNSPLKKAPTAARKRRPKPEAALLASPEPATPEPLSPASASGLETTRHWFVQDEAVAGLAHRNRNLPCQDAAQAVSHPRTALVLADGAGSSAVSEIGAQAVVRSTLRLLDTLDKPLSAWFDRDCPEPQQEARTWGLLLVKHAIGTLKDLAAEHRRELRDFRCTLLVAVVGRQHLLWLKVGDGAIVLEKQQRQTDAQDLLAWTHELVTLGEQGKGEFANQTQFLDALTPDDVQIGCLPTELVSGLALMSDGAAEKLVANDGSRVAPRISTLLAQLRQDKLRRSVLTSMFYQDDFLTGTSGDDRSIALAACENPAAGPAPRSPQIPAADQADPAVVAAQATLPTAISEPSPDTASQVPALVQPPSASPTSKPRKPIRKRR